MYTADKSAVLTVAWDRSLGPLSRADGFSMESLTAGTMVPAYFNFRRLLQYATAAIGNLPEQ
jgi:hypothetical protein